MHTLAFGKIKLQLDSVGSTNIYAQQLLNREKVIEGTVVIANDQHTGKGQQGSSWYSEPSKNLTFSLILQPSFIQAKAQFILSKCIALGIVDYLDNLSVGTVHIKWPNDILLNQAKVSGILIENLISKGKLNHSIIGIGLNVNQVDFGIYQSIATSIKLISGKSWMLEKEFEILLYFLEKRYLQLRNGGIKSIHEAYIDRLFGFEEQHLYEDEQGEFLGKIKGIADDGRIIIQAEGGEEKRYEVKEVRLKARV